MKHGDVRTFAPRMETEYFGMDITINFPSGQKSAIIYVMKPLLDGIISAFHAHNGVNIDQSVERLTFILSRDRHEIENCLLEQTHAVLGGNQLVFPYRNSVMWNPQDDKLVMCVIRIKEEDRLENWLHSGKIFEVIPN